MPNKNTYPDPQPGDLIEIPRYFHVYSHWVIYIKDGDVIHLTPDTSSAFSDSTKIAVIKRESLANVVGYFGYSINNRADKKMEPLPIDQILDIAEEMVGGKVYYSIKEANCEHFVHLLRYGIKKSNQASTFGANVLALAAPLFGLAPLIPAKGKPINTMEDEYLRALERASSTIFLLKKMINSTFFKIVIVAALGFLIYLLMTEF